MLTSRPATAEDIQRFYPDVKCSFRAWVCEIGGHVEGIIGIALARPLASIFTVFTPALRPHLKSLTVLRLVKKLEAWIARCRLPVMAIRQRDERQAVHILKRMGFRFYGLYDGEAVYHFGGA